MKPSILRILISIAAAGTVGITAVTVAMDAVDRTTVVEAAQPETTATTTTVVTATPPTTTPATTTSSTVRPPATTTTTSPPEPAAATLRPGDSSPAVSGLQARLRTLGYWLGVADGTYGHLTEQAVMAFQKVEGLSPDGVAGPGTQAALADARRPVPRSTGGDRMEVDKARQVVLIVRGGQAAWTLNTSTGTEQPYRVGDRAELADTPTGRWKVGWEVDGVDIGELGALYRPKYFHQDGIAVHGYRSVPAYPASHGCVRVSEGAMNWIWAEELLALGSEVWVY